MNKTTGIYIIKNSIDSRVYIGQSINVEKRILEHTYSLHSNKHSNRKLNNFVTKYGFDKISFELLEKCDKQDLNKLEIKWIEFYNSKNNGFNCTDGGEDNPMNHEENRKKVSEALLGRKKSDEWIKKIISNRDIEKTKSSRIKSGITKYVYAYDARTGVKLWECYGFNEMAKIFKVNESNIRQCVNGKMKSAKGIHYSTEIKSTDMVLNDVIKNNTKQEYKDKLRNKYSGMDNHNFGKRYPFKKRHRIKNRITKYCNQIILCLYSLGNTQKQTAEIIGCTQVHVSEVLKIQKETLSKLK